MPTTLSRLLEVRSRRTDVLISGLESWHRRLVNFEPSAADVTAGGAGVVPLHIRQASSLESGQWAGRASGEGVILALNRELASQFDPVSRPLASTATVRPNRWDHMIPGEEGAPQATVVLGESGMGKSFYSRHLACLEIARLIEGLRDGSILDSSKDAVLPLWTKAETLTGGRLEKMGVTERILFATKLKTESTKASECVEWASDRLASNRAVVCIDAIDQVKEEDRHRFSSFLKALVEELPRCQVVFTCRFGTWHDRKFLLPPSLKVDAAEVRIIPLPPEAYRELIRAVAPHARLEELEKKRSLKAACARPLFAGLFARALSLPGGGEILSKGRVSDVYREVLVDQLKRSPSVDVRKYNEREDLAILARIGWELFLMDPSGQGFDRKAWDAATERAGLATSPAEDLLERLSEAGLFEECHGPELRGWSFSHRSQLEFLTAYHLSQLSFDEAWTHLRDRCFRPSRKRGLALDPDWSDVLVLLASIPDEADPRRNPRKSRTDRLITRINRQRLWATADESGALVRLQARMAVAAPELTGWTRRRVGRRGFSHFAQNPAFFPVELTAPEMLNSPRLPAPSHFLTEWLATIKGDPDMEESMRKIIKEDLSFPLVGDPRFSVAGVWMASQLELVDLKIHARRKSLRFSAWLASRLVSFAFPPLPRAWLTHIRWRLRERTLREWIEDRLADRSSFLGGSRACAALAALSWILGQGDKDCREKAAESLYRIGGGAPLRRTHPIEYPASLPDSFGARTLLPEMGPAAVPYLCMWRDGPEFLALLGRTRCPDGLKLLLDYVEERAGTITEVEFAATLISLGGSAASELKGQWDSFSNRHPELRRAGILAFLVSGIDCSRDLVGLARSGDAEDVAFALRAGAIKLEKVVADFAESSDSVQEASCDVLRFREKPLSLDQLAGLIEMIRTASPRVSRAAAWAIAAKGNDEARQIGLDHLASLAGCELPSPSSFTPLSPFPSSLGNRSSWDDSRFADLWALSEVGAKTWLATPLFRLDAPISTMRQLALMAADPKRLQPSVLRRIAYGKLGASLSARDTTQIRLVARQMLRSSPTTAIKDAFWSRRALREFFRGVLKDEKLWNSPESFAPNTGNLDVQSDAVHLPIAPRSANLDPFFLWTVRLAYGIICFSLGIVLVASFFYLLLEVGLKVGAAWLWYVKFFLGLFVVGVFKLPWRFLQDRWL
jgi:hypothetical protein